MANINFYDLESLSNVFTNANYKPATNEIDLYFLIDNPDVIGGNNPEFEKDVTDAVHKANKNFTGTINLYNLATKEANEKMAKEFGVSDAYPTVNDLTNESSYPDEFRITCDTDPDYDENLHPFLMGYNSYNYDTSMLAMYFHDTWLIKGNDCEFTPITAKLMREYNNELFTERFKSNMPSRLAYTFDRQNHSWDGPDYKDPRYLIRKNMMLTGRHIDVARLNEKQRKVGLKRLLGMLGYQILESDKLATNQDTIYTYEELLDLLAYNVSDVVNLENLYNHNAYKSSFILKKGLLDSYPELIYKKKKSEYKPNVSPDEVRRDRMTIDSSSAQFSTNSLCPYDHLSDIQTVSFNYPHEEKAKELGIKQVNVLEECKKFFYENFKQPEIRAEFDRIYDMYKWVEGKNFNESENYMQDYAGDGPLPDELRPHTFYEMPQVNTNLFYYNADGTPSSCFVNFSTGGIHGAEYNKALYEADLEAYDKAMAEFNEKLEQMKIPYNFIHTTFATAEEFYKAKELTLPDGTVVPKQRTKFVLPNGEEIKVSDFAKNNKKAGKIEWKPLPTPAKSLKKPELFTQTDKKWKLNKKYVYTSADMTQHEDFTSYYPNLLRQMMAFYNKGLGYDRYGEVFDNKEKYGKLMKDDSIPKEERDLYSILRNGTKLILNSASGAADATFESNIRMNNEIISMRIIGQLFTWRIGQAQTIYGSKIPSTNTDGLYSALDAEINNPILEREAKEINVEIEPEPTFLISKDSNNRIEMDPDTGKIISASGTDLSCRKGPNPSQSLAHPAIIDWALTEYLVLCGLQFKGMSLSEPFNEKVGLNILKDAQNQFKDKVDFLVMFQNVIASSHESMTYNYGLTQLCYAADEDPSNYLRILSHYSRVFIMKDGTPNTLHLSAATAKKITPATIEKRKKDNEKPIQHNTFAITVLEKNGIDVAQLDLTRECALKKISRIDPEWSMLVLNDDLHFLTDEQFNFIKDNLDYEKYNQMLKDTFEHNWYNQLPGGQVIEDDTEDSDD